MKLKPLTHQTPVTSEGHRAAREFMQLLDEYRREIADLKERVEALEAP